MPAARDWVRTRGAVVFLLLALLPAVPAAQEAPAPGDAPTTVDPPRPVAAVESEPPPPPWTFGFDTEPAMEIASDTVASFQNVTWDLFALNRGIERKGWTRPVVQVPAALLFVLVQHEVLGHGSRAREFGLDPSYGLGPDLLSGYTEIGGVPDSNGELSLISAGGVESTTVQARRILGRLYAGDGGAGSEIPLLLFSKLDLSVYVLSTASPGPPTGDDDDFQSQYEEGNDMAFYLVSRQAARDGAPPEEVWDRTYVVDYDDPLLYDNWDQMRIAAAWNLLDGAVVSGVVGYFRQHVSKRRLRVTPPVWRPRPGLGITFGTRGLLADNAVSRVLDAYFLLPRLTVTAYVRDIDSSIDHTWGVGAGFEDLRLGPVRLGLQVDWWDEPVSLERSFHGRAWNAAAAISWMPSRHWGFTLRGGVKSAGYLPGLRIDEGGYAGAGLLVRY